ncbi:AAA family ATPase [Pseudomonas japonica]|nr:AAA family ATPase [Pseudomonas japonica]
MQIRAFQLHNFGRFENLEASFMENETDPAKVIVLVGNNGAGKTSILKALATSLSWFVGRLRAEKGSGTPISDHSIRERAPSAAIDISVDDAEVGQGPFRWTVARVRQGMKGQHSSVLIDASDLADHYRSQLTLIGNCSLPLVAYYPVERSVLEVPLKVNKRNAFYQLVGYEDFLTPSVNFTKFFEWFRDREDHENELSSKAFKSDSKRDEFERLDKLVHALGEQSIEDIEPLDFKALNKEFSKLRDVMTGIRNFSKVPKDPQLSAVRSAIEQFMPGFCNLRVQRKPRLQLIVDKNDLTLNILQLSQGEKTLMALVGDIARRLAMMNPALENPLHGQGIVLIDEVDMHLHPTWQRRIIHNLTQTFPNCQFILTTHSPLVISDYPDVLVYALNDGQLEKVPSQFGQDANTVLLDVMDTDIRNPEVGAKLNDALDAIQSGHLDKARELIAALDEQLPSSNLELAKVKLVLRKQELRFEKDR